MLVLCPPARGFDTYGSQKVPEDLPTRVRTNVERLYSKDTDVRLAAAKMLGTMGEEGLSAIPFLLEFIEFFDDVPYGGWGEQETKERRAVAEECVAAIGRMGEPAIEPMIDLLRGNRPYSYDEHDEPGRYSEGIPYALARIGEPAVGPLARLFQKEGVTGIYLAGKALGMIGGSGTRPLIEALKSNDKHTRRAAIRGLGHTKDIRAVQALIRLLGIGDETNFDGIIAAESLGRIGTISFGPLVPILDSANPKIRQHAVYAIANIEDPRVIPLIVSRLSDTDIEVRIAAARRLGHKRDTVATDPLIACLDDPEMGVRVETISALKRIRDPKAVMPLTAALADESEWVRSQAANALTRFKDARAVPHLIDALDDTHELVVVHVATALAWTDDHRAVKPLLDQLMNDREYVYTPWNNLTDPEINILSINRGRDRDDAWDIWPVYFDGTPNYVPPSARAAIVYALGCFDDRRIVKPLIDTLNDEDPRVRESAVWALGDHGDMEAFGPIAAMLRDNDPGVQKIAILALPMIDDVLAIDPLVATLRDKNKSVREATFLSLRTLGEPAIGPLIESLKKKDNSFTDRSSRVISTLGGNEKYDSVFDAYYQEEPMGPNYYAALALESITGQNFGQDLDKWIEWHNSR